MVRPITRRLPKFLNIEIQNGLSNSRHVLDIQWPPVSAGDLFLDGHAPRSQINQIVKSGGGDPALTNRKRLSEDFLDTSVKALLVASRRFLRPSKHSFGICIYLNPWMPNLRIRRAHCIPEGVLAGGPTLLENYGGIDAQVSFLRGCICVSLAFSLFSRPYPSLGLRPQQGRCRLPGTYPFHHEAFST